MSYTRHHCIVVTSPLSKPLLKAHLRICELAESANKSSGAFGPIAWVSPVSPYMINGVRSFFIGPDGSNDGWSESDDGDRFRDAAIAILDSFSYEDNSLPFSYAEIQYDDDNKQNMILRSK